MHSLPISALQHLLFCDRQCALIHLDREWTENRFTAEGRVLHERKADEILHPFLQEKTTVGLLPHLQARLLARYLRGDLDAYPPFLVK